MYTENEMNQKPDPYVGISASLFSETIGNIEIGEEAGIVSAQEGVSGVVYHQLDFGTFGSNEITIPIYTEYNGIYPIEIWKGNPQGDDGIHLTTVVYQKSSKARGYQQMTFQLPRRIRGVLDLGFLFHGNLHIKEFSFRKEIKSFSRVYAAEADSGSGDMFRVDIRAVTDMGKNVTLEYGNMDFGPEGVSGVRIGGRTTLEINPVHIQFIKDNGEVQHRIVEFKGLDDILHRMKFDWQEFGVEPLKGSGKILFTFGHSCEMDFEGFEFFR